MIIVGTRIIFKYSKLNILHVFKNSICKFDDFLWLFCHEKSSSIFSNYPSSHKNYTCAESTIKFWRNLSNRFWETIKKNLFSESLTEDFFVSRTLRHRVTKFTLNAFSPAIFYFASIYFLILRYFSMAFQRSYRTVAFFVVNIEPSYPRFYRSLYSNT